MRLLHTSDWHLGRSFGPVSLHDDQAAFVDWFVALAVDEAVDLVVLAGDVYDRAVPPTRSIDLVRSALVRLQRAGIHVVVVTGNHDGAERVAAYDGLLDATGVHIRGGYARAGEVLRLTFPDGPLDVVPVPFLDPVVAPPDAAGELLAGMRRPTHHTVAAHALALARALGIGRRSLAVAHAFVVGGDIAPYVSDSERELAVGGTGAVDVATFAGFSYTALGHLHAPQEVGGALVRYSGSPLAYSFSETRPKQVVLVELSPEGTATSVPIEVPVGRGVRTVTGSIADLVAAPRAEAVPCFVRAVLTDPGAVLDAKSRLQAVYPYVVEVELRPAPRPGDQPGIPVNLRRRLRPAEAAVEFWRDVHAGEPDEHHRDLLERGLSAVMG